MKKNIMKKMVTLLMMIMIMIIGYEFITSFLHLVLKCMELVIDFIDDNGLFVIILITVTMILNKYLLNNKLVELIKKIFNK